LHSVLNLSIQKLPLAASHKKFGMDSALCFC
jgi:hypothetical protein